MLVSALDFPILASFITKHIYKVETEEDKSTRRQQQTTKAQGRANKAQRKVQKEAERDAYQDRENISKYRFYL